MWIDRVSAVFSQYRLVLAILFLALIIRGVGLKSQSLSMDEVLEYETALQSVRLIIQDSNSFPPLYHLVLKCWISLSEHELASRVLSVVFGMLSLCALLYWVGRGVGERAALWTLAFTAVSPYHVYYSQYGRPYALYLLLACCAIGSFLVWARDDSSRARLVFVASAVLGGYTHYYFAVLLVTLGLLAIPTFGWRFVVRRLLPVAMLIGVLCAPLVFLLRTDLDYQRDIAEHRPLSMMAVGYTYFSLMSGYSLGPSRGELHTLSTADAVRLVMPWVLGLGAAVFPLLVAGARRLRRQGQLWIWLGLLTLPVVLVGLLSAVFGVTYNTRFLIWMVIPLSVIVGAGLASMNGRVKLVLVAALALFSATAVCNRRFVEKYANEDSRSAADFLSTRTTRPAITCSGYMCDPINFYLGRRGRVVGLPDPGEREGSVELALDRLATDYAGRRIWLVYSREYHGDPDGRILRFACGGHNPSPVYAAAGIRVFDCGIPRRTGGEAN